MSCLHRWTGGDGKACPECLREKPLTKMSIAQLEALLSRDEDVEIEILPNGEVVAKGTSKQAKPVTFRENLGGEYGIDGLAERIRAKCAEYVGLGIWHYRTPEEIAAMPEAQ
jgi:hypothetical protein